jgi:hypothetical protein
MKSVPSALLPILRSQVAGDLLALLYLHPEAEYSLTEAATTIGASLNAVHYEAGKLSESGPDQHARAREPALGAGGYRLTAHPAAHRPARRHVRAAPRPHGPARRRRADRYIYGSWAARYRGEPGPAPADVDILVVGTADPDDLDDVAERAQRTLHRPVSIRRVRPETWNVANPGDPFLQSVKTRPLVRIGRGAA